MTTTVEAIYENGMLRLAAPLPLPEKTHVRVTIQSELSPNDDGERSAWLKLSEEALTRTWNNSGDDVFDDLLQKSRSDVVLFPIPLTDLTSRKVRPAVIMGR